MTANSRPFHAEANALTSPALLRTERLTSGHTPLPIEQVANAGWHLVEHRRTHAGERVLPRVPPNDYQALAGALERFEAGYADWADAGRPVAGPAADALRQAGDQVIAQAFRLARQSRQRVRGTPRGAMGRLIAALERTPELQATCAGVALDDLGVPREQDGRSLALAERIALLGAPIVVAWGSSTGMHEVRLRTARSGADAVFDEFVAAMDDPEEEWVVMQPATVNAGEGPYLRRSWVEAEERAQAEAGEAA